MKQIIPFFFRNLRNGEHDQLHNNFETEINAETAKKLNIEAELAPYLAARGNEKLALQAELGSAYTLNVTESDGFRDETDKGFCMFVESHLYHPDPEVRESARKINRIIDQYGNVRKLTYNDESSQMTNRNVEIVKNYAADLAKLGKGWGTAWLNSLDTANNQFVDHFGTRASDEATQVVINTLEARAATDAAWEAIARRINALVVVNGEADYAAFIDKVNYYIDYNKGLISARKAKKDSGTDAGEEAK